MTDPRPLLARLGNALSRRYATPVETHPRSCRCQFHEGWRAGYFQAGAEVSMAADQDARFRRFLRAYEMPAGEGRR